MLLEGQTITFKNVLSATFTDTASIAIASIPPDQRTEEEKRYLQTKAEEIALAVSCLVLFYLAVNFTDNNRF
jgi:hypothetical protein